MLPKSNCAIDRILTRGTLTGMRRFRDPLNPSPLPPLSQVPHPSLFGPDNPMTRRPAVYSSSSPLLSLILCTAVTERGRGDPTSLEHQCASLLDTSQARLTLSSGNSLADGVGEPSIGLPSHPRKKRK
ncbi:hypothetical protein RRG08_032742 [Elysia crispata]|uniref:Uncharacterized protein n=1 Tax=Elysia crispata TaxID=231223 RepID=A0AAE1D517_9GAST|nr:hypothetical protein RRG08_032742 [Elysia crispata]